MIGSQPNFQGQLSSAQVILGRVTRALGVRPEPQKVGFMPILSPPRVLGAGGCVIPFGKGEKEAKKLMGTEF